MVKKDQNNIEPSDRVRIVQLWKDYLFLLVKVNAAREEGVDRKSPVNWEVFYKFTIGPYKQLLATMEEEQGKQKIAMFKVEPAMEFRNIT